MCQGFKPRNNVGKELQELQELQKYVSRPGLSQVAAGKG
jgi:hypothetical protein